MLPDVYHVFLGAVVEAAVILVPIWAVSMWLVSWAWKSR
jgi:hypothetical protein